MRFDLGKGFPLLTTKKVPLGLIKSELLWFLNGDTNIQYLLKHKNHIWDEWAFKKWVESDEYEGPDMKDFGLRCQKDPEFDKVYREQMKLLPKNTVIWATFTVHNGVTGRRAMARRSIRSRT